MFIVENAYGRLTAQAAGVANIQSSIIVRDRPECEIITLCRACAAPLLPMLKNADLPQEVAVATGQAFEGMRMPGLD